MEPIKDLGELQPTLDSLEKKRLIMYLTPPGRGSVVTHALYLDRELEKVRREAGAMHVAATLPEPPSTESDAPLATPHRPALVTPAPLADRTNWSEQIATLRKELAELKSELAAARTDFEATAQQLRQELADLNRQLGN